MVQTFNKEEEYEINNEINKNLINLKLNHTKQTVDGYMTLIDFYDSHPITIFLLYVKTSVYTEKE